MTAPDTTAEIAISLDIDWAPDFMIDFVANLLISEKVKATWFVTHAAPAVDRLKNRPDLFECGIHPNLMAGSSHGATRDEVLAHCNSLVPGAACVRTHGLVQSTSLMDHFAGVEGYAVDASSFLPRAENLRPVKYVCADAQMIKIPFAWEDDFEMRFPDPAWRVGDVMKWGGLQVLNFHPVHIYLNGPDMTAYESIKDLGQHLSDLTEEQVAPFIQNGEGPRSMFMHAVEHLSGSGGGHTFLEIAAKNV